jgi:hypothetical protein
MRARTYAANTSVPVARSRVEIEELLERFGASGFGYAREGSRETVGFVYQGKQVRLELTIPIDLPSLARRDQERRRRWRALVMVVKALLVGVADGILSFEEAFLSYFVTPSGETIGDRVIPELEAAVHRGEIPALMSGR